MENMEQEQLETSIEMDIPVNKAGAVIGKGGETIKRLQAEYSVRMEMQQESSEAVGRKALVIKGGKGNVEGAKQAVEDVLAQAQERSTPTQMRLPDNEPVSFVEVIVPSSSVGIIIGKGGETIKRLQAETGTTIQFKQDEYNTVERIVTVRGSELAISNATKMLGALIERASMQQMQQQMGGYQQAQQQMVLMPVPADKAGLIIGRGGETIKQIQSETGARVGMQRDPPPNPNERIVEIKGTPEQVRLVQHIIGTKIGQIPIGAEYQGYGHAQQTQHQQGPLLNPQTGQPDYSKEWAAYYRSMGMHQQADEIENQLRERMRHAARYGSQY